MKKIILYFFIPAGLLLALGALDVYRKASWKEVTDGITWAQTAKGLTAVRVDVRSEAYLRAGIRKGDILSAINKNPVRTKIDVLKNLLLAGGTDQIVSYEINREGQQIYPSFYPQRRGVDFTYYYFVVVGLTTLLIGLVVFLNAKRQASLPYLFFYALVLAFSALMILSPTGELDTLDMVFYALDKLAFLAFPPLLLHFFMIFPLRKRFLKERSAAIVLIYTPAVVLGLARLRFHLPIGPPFSEAGALRYQTLLERLDVAHYVFFGLLALGILTHSTLRAPNLMVRKQLRLIVYGLGFGLLPSAVFYFLPSILGRIPSRAEELTVLLLALVPLTFSYSISRYRLVNIEVLLKKAATLTFSFFVIAFLYFLVSSQTGLVPENRLNAALLGVVAIILGATLFTPLKRLFQSLLDRVVYRRSYEHRKTLLFISRELSRERNLQKLAQALLEAIVNALSLKTAALLLAEEGAAQAFQVLSTRGEEASLPARVTFEEPLGAALAVRDHLSNIPATHGRLLQAEMDKFAAFGVYHFLPLKVEDKVVGCLAMGRKHDGSFLTSEDWELVTAVSASAALALENAYLYSRESVRAMEMQRLKDYSENIIESLTVGVVVVDQEELVIGWNRVIEEQFGLRKEAALQRSLPDVLGPRTYAALFPAEGQSDFRVMSEVALETADGTKRIFDVARTPLLDNALQPYGTIIVFEDITDKIHMQQQLLTSEKLASIGLLSAGVAHEINTPLTGISSYIQMLQKKLTDTHYAQLLEKIEAQTDRVAKIIKNLLTFARNPSDTAFHRIDLKESLEEIVSLIDYKLKNMNIRLRLELEAIPPLYAQGERLQQVFINIILNALDAMPQGGTLGLAAAPAGAAAVVRISDTGTGIKPEHLPRIFDPFFTTKGVGKGTGLGLSISYAIVKEHDGHIQVESEVGKGTTFIITLPLGDSIPAKHKSSLFRT